MTTATDRELVPEWDVADRMRKALRVSGLGVAEMAEYLGVNRVTAGTWINGRNRPSIQTLRLWAIRCGVSFEWLRDGTTAAQPPEPPVGFEPTTYRLADSRSGSARYGRIIQMPARLWPVKVDAEERAA